MRLIHGLMIAALVLLTGCGTTPSSNYYLLSSPENGLPGGAEPSLGIGPIVIPEYLNRNSMVFLEGENALHIASYERWAEPLGDGIQRVMAMNLAGMLDTQNVRAFPWAQSRAPEYGIRLRIAALDAGQGKARLVAEWVLLNESATSEVTRRLSRLEAGIPEGDDRGSAVAAAYSELLYRLSEEIAAAVRETDAAVGG